MATAKDEKKPQAKAKTTAKAKPERVPTKDELILEEFLKKGFVLVQYIGSKTRSKIAPSPTHVCYQFGMRNYGLVFPKQWLLVHKDDVKAAPMYYRRPTAKEKPKKEEIRLHPSIHKEYQVRVTWEGMPVDELDPFNRR